MSTAFVPYFVSDSRHVLRDIREQIRVRLVTVTSATNLRVMDWDGLGQDLGGAAVTIGLPATSLVRGGDPLAPDAAVGRWGWEHRWPITLQVARTTDRVSTLLVDDLVQDVTEALISDPTLGGTCLASALDSSTADETDPDAAVPCHVITFELVTVLHLNL